MSEVGGGETRVVDQRDPHGGHAREDRRPPFLEIVEGLVRVEAHAQQHAGAARQLPQHDAGQRIDVEQRQDEDDLVLGRVAGGQGGLPGIIDRHGGGDVLVAEHRPLGHPGGAAGVLQQRHVLGLHLRPGVGRLGPGDEGREGDDARPVGNGQGGKSGRPEIRVLGDDQPVDEPLLVQLEGHAEQRRDIGRHQRPRAGILQLVGQHPLGIEGREVDEAHAGLRRAEEADRMGRHVGQVEPDGVLAADPGAQQRRTELPDPLAEVGIGDDAVAELEGGTGCE
jgi:hypothetical protein